MRFKFPCSCGKHLAAYSWMAGKIVECPKCGTTLTIPTPERAAQLQESLPGNHSVVSLYTASRSRSSWGRVRKWLWVVAVVAAVAGTAFLLWARWWQPHS